MIREVEAHHPLGIPEAVGLHGEHHHDLTIAETLGLGAQLDDASHASVADDAALPTVRRADVHGLPVEDVAHVPLPATVERCQQELVGFEVGELVRLAHGQCRAPLLSGFGGVDEPGLGGGSASVLARARFRVVAEDLDVGQRTPARLEGFTPVQYGVVVHQQQISLPPVVVVDVITAEKGVAQRGEDAVGLRRGNVGHSHAPALLLAGGRVAVPCSASVSGRAEP